MNERQLLTEIRLQQNKSTTPLQLMTEREFRFFLFHLLDNPREFSDFINTLSPYKYSEMLKLEQQSRGESAFSQLLRVYTEGENPLSISTPLTQAERRAFILELIPESLQTTRKQISKMDMSKDVFESFAQTFGYFHNLAIENETISARIKEIVSLKRGAPEPVESLITTARSVPTLTPKLSARTTPITSGINTPLATQRTMAYSSTDFRTSARKPLAATARSTTIDRKAKTLKVKPKDVLKPQVANFTKQIDLEAARSMTLDELNGMIQERERQLLHNKQEAATLSQRIVGVKKEVINLEEEIEQMESQYEALLAQETARVEEETQNKINNTQMLSSRKREANSITHQLQAAIEENKKLKKQLTGITH